MMLPRMKKKQVVAKLRSFMPFQSQVVEFAFRSTAQKAVAWQVHAADLKVLPDTNRLAICTTPSFLQYFQNSGIRCILEGRSVFDRRTFGPRKYPQGSFQDGQKACA